MNREDIDNLFRLLELYFPNSPKIHNKQLRMAWLLLLEPYPPEVVKRALAERLRENKNFPDPQAIAVKCGAVFHIPEETQSRCVTLSHADQRCRAESFAWQEDWHRELHERGLLSLREAMEAGMSVGQWLDSLTVVWR